MTPLNLTEAPSGELIDDDPSRAPLVHRVRAGVSWNASSTLITELIRLGRSIVLARLLVPEDFGLFGMALTIVAALNALTALGLERTIIATRFESRVDLEKQLNTVWSVELIRCVVVALLVAAAAWPMAKFYGQPQLILIIPALAATTLFLGFQNIGLSVLRKEISFARIFWYDLATNVTGIVLTLVLALIVRNVWALVIGLLLTSALGTIFSYVFHPYRPRLAFESTALRCAIELGKYALVIAIASYVITMADNIIIGWLLGPSALGNYSLAYNMASTPISVLVLAFSSVLFPAYAEISATRPEKLEMAFLKVFSISLLILLTISGMLFLLGDEIVRLLFGSKWTDAGTVLPILAIVLPVRGLSLIVTTVFFALNRHKQVAIARSLEALVFLAVIYPLVNAFGLAGAAWAGLIAYSFSLVNRLLTLRNVIPGVWSRLLRISLSAVVAAVTGFLLAEFALNFVSSPWARLLAGGLLTTIIPTVGLLLLRPDLRRWVIEWFS